MLLLPPSLDDWLPEGHLARFVADLVDEVLGLSPVLADYTEKRGFPPYGSSKMHRSKSRVRAAGCPKKPRAVPPTDAPGGDGPERRRTRRIVAAATL